MYHLKIYSVRKISVKPILSEVYYKYVFLKNLIKPKYLLIKTLID